MPRRPKSKQINEVDEGVMTESVVKGFTILSRVKEAKASKLRRILPDWLLSPIPIEKSVTSTIPVDELNILDDVLKKNFTRSGINFLFPTQQMVIPFLIQSHRNWHYRPPDICVSAPTGSGKTLAFVAPIIQILHTRLTCELKALVILPVMDLASQVYQVLKKFIIGTNLKVELLSGQKAFLTEQMAIVKNGKSLVDIIVSTPGRLVDHIQNTEGFCLKNLQFLVIDEADRVLDEAQSDWYTFVKNSCIDDEDGLTPATSYLQHPPQKILLSATLTHDPEILQRLNLFCPKLFSTSWNTDKFHVEEELGEELDETIACQYVIPESLQESYIKSDQYHKPLLLYHHIKNKLWKNVLCFCNTVDTTHRLASLIKLLGNIEIREFSSKLTAMERKKIIRDFSMNKIDLIVCTDSMGRGMDLPNVEFVVSYDPPLYVKNYIHRIGRTARAGRKGHAITLLQNSEIKHFQKILRALKKTNLEFEETATEVLANYTELYDGCLENLQSVLLEEKKSSRNVPVKSVTHFRKQDKFRVKSQKPIH